jgi:hypothetical protein
MGLAKINTTLLLLELLTRASYSQKLLEALEAPKTPTSRHATSCHQSQGNLS